MVNSGRNAAMVMITEKKIGRSTSTAAAKIRRNFSDSRVSGSETSRRTARARWRKMFSTMMTVGSTRVPGSIAPIDSRLADSPRRTVMITARNNATGIVADTISAERRSPRNIHEKDQHHAEQHVVKHRAYGDGNKVAAVIEGIDMHTGRQRAVGVHSCHRLSYALHHIHRALELLHQDDAGHDVGRAVASGDAEPRRETDLHFGHIGDQHRKAAL